jgi:hypothetical protein
VAYGESSVAMMEIKLAATTRSSLTRCMFAYIYGTTVLGAKRTFDEA